MARQRDGVGPRPGDMLLRDGYVKDVDHLLRKVRPSARPHGRFRDGGTE